MPDYGHPLRFGAFITPVNEPAARPVELAILSDALGLDLATFQDHPYQPAFHDTWTLLSWVAARTERIHVSGNVLSSPLRQPAVLARAAASLDRLSGGRFELGLGAGAFFGPIAAMGGPEWTPREAVSAVSEAIDVIRGVWDARQRTPLRLDGEHYRLDGAKRGPAPAHDIPIWLGAYKPRMLRLVGTKGDGWLPSLQYLEPGALERGNAIIDDAAREAGRQPREIVRLLNLPAGMRPDELAALAIEHGVSVFIAMADDERALRRFAGEIAPEVRSIVERERHDRGTGVGPERPEAALALRAPGIDYNGIPDALRGTAIEPGDPGYARASANYLRGGKPGLILRPRDVDGVREAVRFAARHPAVSLGVRSAGHGISGRSVNDGGIVIDVAALNAIEIVDRERRRVRIGPGARWIDVARTLTPHGMAITSGDYGGVGVGGLATAGGIGWLAREHGLTIDHVRAVDVVLADGALVHASPDEHSDLFWAVRGAGANVGVVVAFEFEADAVSRLAFARLAFDASDTAEFVERWGATVEASPRAVSGTIILGPARGAARVAQALIAVDSEDPERIVALLEPFAGIAPLLAQDVRVLDYEQVMSMFFHDAPHQGRGEPVARSALVEHLDAAVARDAVALLDSGTTHFFQIRSVGGAVGDVPPDATAYAGRSANFSIVSLGTSNAIDRYWAALERHASGMYLSFDTRQGREVVERAFPPAHLARLRGIKRRYDPDGVFRDNFFIEPSLAADAA